MIPWNEPTCRGNEVKYLKQVIKSNFLNDGDWTTRFENEFAKIHKAKYAVGVTSGTMALFLALKALYVGNGDEVIVPDLTFIATANAVTWTGAKPILTDIEVPNLNLNPEKIVYTPKTKAIILVHINGRITSYDYNLPVIQDCCQALGTAFDGLIGCYSFAPSKIITTGQGGMVVTNDEVLHKRLRELKDQGRYNRGTGGDDIHPVLGFNAKLTNLQSAVGLAQLEKLTSRLKRMKEIYQHYLTLYITPHRHNPLWIDYYSENRDGLYDYLLDNGIQCRKFWYPLHTQRPYECQGDFSCSNFISNNYLWLPSSFNLTDKEIDYVTRKVREFESRKRVPDLW